MASLFDDPIKSMLNIVFAPVQNAITTATQTGGRSGNLTNKTFRQVWRETPALQKQFKTPQAYEAFRLGDKSYNDQREAAGHTTFDGRQTQTTAPTAMMENNPNITNNFYGSMPDGSPAGNGNAGTAGTSGTDGTNGNGGTNGVTPGPVTTPTGGGTTAPGDGSYSFMPAALGGVLGGLSALGKDPVFDRHGTDHFWRDHYKEQFAGAYEDARTDPYEGDFFRNANRSHLTATNAMLENSANLRGRQAMNTGMMYGGGYSRDLASMAPGFYAQQAGNLAKGYDIRDRNIQMENGFVGHNTDKQQDLFQFEVANGTHSEYNKGFNLLGKIGGSMMAGAAGADNMYASLRDRSTMADLYAQGGNGAGEAAGTGTDTPGPVTPAPVTPNTIPSGLKPIEDSWNASGWFDFPQAAKHTGVMANTDIDENGNRVMYGGLEPPRPIGQPTAGQPFDASISAPLAVDPFGTKKKRKSLFNNPWGRSPLFGN